MENVTVNAAALRMVLNALNGPDHHIRELQATRKLPSTDNPINRLIMDFNKALTEAELAERRKADGEVEDLLADANVITINVSARPHIGKVNSAIEIYLLLRAQGVPTELIEADEAVISGVYNRPTEGHPMLGEVVTILKTKYKITVYD